MLTASLIITMIACASRVPQEGSWEGIENSLLRVYVYYEYADDFDGRTDSDPRELLLGYGRTRAEVLLMSYMRMHVAGIGRTIACQQMIPEIAARGTIRHLACDTGRCAAYIDFDVRDFLEAAGFSAQR